MNTSSPEFIRQLGTAIKTSREEQGLTQQAFAAKAGLHRTYISDIERGARNVSIESVLKISDALAVPVSVLFSRVEQTLANLARGSQAAGPKKKV